MFVDLLGSKGCNMGGQPALLTILNIHKTGTNRAQPGQARYPNKLKKAFHKKGLFFIKNHKKVLLLILFTLV